MQGDALTHHSSAALALTETSFDDLEVRLATTRSEIAAAQRIRYRVFYEEMGAIPSAAMQAQELDFDDYDTVCDHLLVLAGGEVVGTYRLIRRHAAALVGDFYSAAEFDIAPFRAVDGEILELGRSCVDARWRHRGTLQLLWQGVAAYMARHRVRLLFGCASLPGTDPAALAPVLTYLHDNHLAPPALRARALPHRAIDIESLRTECDARRVLAALPPLLKGYLRLGGVVGEGAVIDHQFNTTDMLVAVNADDIADRYLRRFAS
jgi:putative hemolysin